jgi:redox-sensitive bicupin YhaK (pirin superfamily)
MDLLVDRILKADPRAAHSPHHLARLVVSPDDFDETSPFLLMAEDWFAPPAGFPDHPHRGMQTVTFVVEGGLEHRDHTGAYGVLGEGDVQWMTAGRGVIHSEMPRPPGVHTLQLWLNLPAARKMERASYRDQRRADTPARRGDGFEVRVYAGKLDGIEQPHSSLWPLELFDVRVEAGHEVSLRILPGYRGFLYFLDGSGRLLPEDVTVKEEDVAWFRPVPEGGEDGRFRLRADTKMRALLYAGPVIAEPVVAHGPFVMNTIEEIRKAYEDYKHGRLVDAPLRTTP